MGEGMGVGNMGNTCEGVDIDLLNKGLDGSMIDDGEGEDDGIPMASVPSVLHYLRTQLQQSRGALGVNLLVGGYDVHSHRATLAAVHPHGSMDIVTYAALGSGGLAATGVLESKYPVIGCGGCSVEEGIRLAVDAVRAGIDNDLGSGSQVDVCVVGREGVVYRRGVVREEELEWLSDDEGVTTPNEDGEKTNRDFLTSGVNGFGNVPFAIQSRRVIFSGENGADRERRKWLDGVVGTK